MSHMSLMQRPPGPRFRPCQHVQPQPLFCPARSLRLTTKPAVACNTTALSSRTNRVEASSGLPIETHTDAANVTDRCDKVDALRSNMAEWELGGLPMELTILHAGLWKMLLQLIGCVGVFVFAFGDFGRSSGQLTLNPNFPQGEIGLMLLVIALILIPGALLSPVKAQVRWMNRERRWIADWGKETVDYYLKVARSRSRRDCVWDHDPASYRKEPEQSLSNPPPDGADLPERVEYYIREHLIKTVLLKHKEMIDEFERALTLTITAFTLYSFAQSSLPVAIFHMSETGAQLLLSLCHTCAVMFPVLAMCDVLGEYIELEFVKRTCLAWCGKKSMMASRYSL